MHELVAALILKTVALSVAGRVRTVHLNDTGLAWNTVLELSYSRDSTVSSTSKRKKGI